MVLEQNPPFPRGEEANDASYAVAMLLSHKRPSAALELLRTAIHHKVALETSLLMDAIETWLEPLADAGEPDRRRSARQDILLVFQELQRRVEQEGSLESIATDWRRSNWPASGWWRGIRNSPSPFTDCSGTKPSFSSRYWDSRTNRRTRQGKSAKRSRWKKTSELEMRTGCSDIGMTFLAAAIGQTVDEKSLLDWVQKARSLAKVRGLLEICDSRIGEVLAYAPAEADGSWPCIPVRDVLEEIGAESEEILKGFHDGIYVKREVYERGTEGRRSPGARACDKISRFR